MNARGDIRLLISDVDGTLVTSDKVLTEAAKAAVGDLHKAGIVFAITSSRPPRGLRMLIEPLALQGPIAGCNGALIVHPDLSLIASHPLDFDAARRAIALMIARGLDVWVYTDEDLLVRDPAAPHVAREASILQFPPIQVRAFSDDVLARAMKIVGVSDDVRLIAAGEAETRDALGAAASVERSQSYFIDVTHPQANKGAVVISLSKLLGITPAQIATIGDMPNDVLMFRDSGLSIAMGNASAEVKAQASAVTADNEDDGFAKAVRRFVLGTA